MQHLPLVFPFRYAKLGYVATAHAVENVAGMPWERFTETRILGPLGMTRTTFSREKAMSDPNHAGGSMWRGGRDMPVPMQGTTPVTNSTGGLYSTAEDMGKWLLLQLGNGTYAGKEIVRASSMAEMQKAHIPTGRGLPFPEIVNAGYGLGWFIDLYRGETLIEHGGGHWGVSSIVAFLPGRGLGVSILVNEQSDVQLPLPSGPRHRDDCGRGKRAHGADGR
jgi:CubicO group peptidase (beta-lactamase class C family)